VWDPYCARPCRLPQVRHIPWSRQRTGLPWFWRCSTDASLNCEAHYETSVYRVSSHFQHLVDSWIPAYPHSPPPSCILPGSIGSQPRARTEGGEKANKMKPLGEGEGSLVWPESDNWRSLLQRFLHRSPRHRLPLFPSRSASTAWQQAATSSRTLNPAATLGMPPTQTLRASPAPIPGSWWKAWREGRNTGEVEVMVIWTIISRMTLTLRNGSWNTRTEGMGYHFSPLLSYAAPGLPTEERH
jgi:hypothetical protein